MKPTRKPDDGLRHIITDNLPAFRGSVIFWVSIETALTASGVPDLWGCWRGRQAWVECKSTRALALTSLTEFQVGFQLQLARAGGRGLVLTRRRHWGGPRLGPPVDELWVHDGAITPRLRADGLRAEGELLRAPGGPSEWPWERVGELVFGV